MASSTFFSTNALTVKMFTSINLGMYSQLVYNYSSSMMQAIHLVLLFFSFSHIF